MNNKLNAPAAALALAMATAAVENSSHAETATPPEVKQVQQVTSDQAKACAKPVRVSHIDQRTNVEHRYLPGTTPYMLPEGDNLLVRFARADHKAAGVTTNMPGNTSKIAKSATTSDGNIVLRYGDELNETTVPVAGKVADTARIDFNEEGCAQQSLPVMIIPRLATAAEVQAQQDWTARIQKYQVARDAQQDVVEKNDKAEVIRMVETRGNGEGNTSILGGTGPVIPIRGAVYGMGSAKISTTLSESRDGHRLQLEMPVGITYGKKIAVAPPPAGYAFKTQENTQTVIDAAAMLVGKIQLGDNVTLDIGGGPGVQGSFAGKVNVGDRYSDKQGWEVPSQTEVAGILKGKFGLTIQVTKSKPSTTLELALEPTLTTRTLDRQGDAASYGGPATGRSFGATFPIQVRIGGTF